jgi:hypothetical protein
MCYKFVSLKQPEFLPSSFGMFMVFHVPRRMKYLSGKWILYHDIAFPHSTFIQVEYPACVLICCVKVYHIQKPKSSS